MKNDKPISVQTAALTNDEQRAIKSVWRGDATEYQQRLALKTIVNKLCRADDLLYVPNSFDETAFLQGRGFVGKRIMKVLNQPLEKLEDTANENP
ncbi:MAG: hypothetical protein Unbinned8596contig1000_8 [Prokaryotic dsDNA virus sp.]|nr:MAG: hypothetical protein Unbinned8596contig1000_8 [Prokaryotic dsDNA virus sp.]|tara:strand:+ start:17116 stop:17400 length:285 start_codon:yes stop_codon:yes gene_type:complete